MNDQFRAIARTDEARHALLRPPSSVLQRLRLTKVRAIQDLHFIGQRGRIDRATDCEPGEDTVRLAACSAARRGGDIRRRGGDDDDNGSTMSKGATANWTCAVKALVMQTKPFPTCRC